MASIRLRPGSRQCRRKIEFELCCVLPDLLRHVRVRRKKEIFFDFYVRGDDGRERVAI